ncbi:MAG: hypothetical protein HQ521_12540, partial [Bacteroidetes bacterium]|nr:hypothetical protein [Bacteroidota bacterium]
DIEIIDNNAWVSTNNGIIQLELDTFKYSHYVQSHGIGDKEYSAGGLFYDVENNILYAGGLTGLTSIKLNDFKNIASRTDNILSKISVINKEGMVLRNYFNIPQHISVNEGNTLLIELGNKDAAIRSKSNFTYKIEKKN